MVCLTNISVDTLHNGDTEDDDDDDDDDDDNNNNNNNNKQDALYRLTIIPSQLYMFRAMFSPIIRST